MIRWKWQGRESSSEGRERDNENISHCIQDGGASQTCTCSYAILMDSFKVNKTVTLKQIIKQQKCVLIVTETLILSLAFLPQPSNLTVTCLQRFSPLCNITIQTRETNIMSHASIQLILWITCVTNKRNKKETKTKVNHNVISWEQIKKIKLSFHLILYFQTTPSLRWTSIGLFCSI